jgi:hypothetical protein
MGTWKRRLQPCGRNGCILTVEDSRLMGRMEEVSGRERG